MNCNLPKMLPLLFLSLWLQPESLSAKIEKVAVCTQDWKDHTESNGAGLIHVLFRKIYENQKIRLIFTYAPFKRCVLYMGRGIADIAPAYYKNSERPYLYSKRYLTRDVLTVVYARHSRLVWKGRSSLRNKKVGWMRGYQFEFLSDTRQPLQVVEFGNLEYGLQKLLRHRIDYILDYEGGVRIAVKKLKIREQLYIHYNVLKGRNT